VSLNVNCMINFVKKIICITKLYYKRVIDWNAEKKLPNKDQNGAINAVFILRMYRNLQILHRSASNNIFVRLLRSSRKAITVINVYSEIEPTSTENVNL